jgi:competence protein ComEA
MLQKVKKMGKEGTCKMNKRFLQIAGALAVFAAAGCYGYAFARPRELPPEAANAAMAELLAEADKPEAERGAMPARAPTAPAKAQMPSTEAPTPSAGAPKAPAAAPTPPAKAPTPPAGARTAPAAAPTPPVAAPEKHNHTVQASTPRLDLNEATLEQLMDLPGIGESKAKAIVELRGRLGKFTKVEQLLEAKGIGDKVLEKLKPFVRVGGS